jgi:hypothetical protein
LRRFWTRFRPDFGAATINLGQELTGGGLFL